MQSVSLLAHQYIWGNWFGNASTTCSNNFVFSFEKFKKSTHKQWMNWKKSTGRDSIWTGDYAACGRCHLAHAAWVANVPYLLQGHDGSTYPTWTTLVVPIHTGVASRHATLKYINSWFDFKVGQTSLNPEVRLFTHQVCMNTWFDTEVIFCASVCFMHTELGNLHVCIVLFQTSTIHNNFDKFKPSTIVQCIHVYM